MELTGLYRSFDPTILQDQSHETTDRYGKITKCSTSEARLIVIVRWDEDAHGRLDSLRRDGGQLTSPGFPHPRRDDSPVGCVAKDFLEVAIAIAVHLVRRLFDGRALIGITVVATENGGRILTNAFLHP